LKWLIKEGNRFTIAGMDFVTADSLKMFRALFQENF